MSTPDDLRAAVDGRPAADGVAGEDFTLPLGEAADSLEALAAERSARTPVVYLLIVGMVAAGCAALPLVRVPVAVRATGMVRPSVEKLEIRAGVAGVVTEVRMSEGRMVGAGEPLVQLSVPAHSARRSYLLDVRRELVAAIRDLERLSSEPDGRGDGWQPVSTGYRAEVRSYLSGVAERRGRIDRIARELTRSERLVARGLAAAVAAEDLRFDLTQAEAEAERFSAESRARWARQLAEQRAQLRDVDRELAVAQADARLTRVVAPVAGSIEAMRPIVAGSLVTAGERLATLSPDAPPQIEAYLGAREIVLVRPGDQALVRVDGYDQAEWGRLTARVASIAEDHVIAAGRPVFRIVIAVDTARLRRSDGRIGELRKGMTVEARIVVARPTVYTLLRRNLTDWIHPRVPAG